MRPNVDFNIGLVSVHPMHVRSVFEYLKEQYRDNENVGFSPSFYTDRIIKNQSEGRIVDSAYNFHQQYGRNKGIRDKPISIMECPSLLNTARFNQKYHEVENNEVVSYLRDSFTGLTKNETYNVIVMLYDKSNQKTTYEQQLEDMIGKQILANPVDEVYRVWEKEPQKIETIVNNYLLWV